MDGFACNRETVVCRTLASEYGLDVPDEIKLSPMKYYSSTVLLVAIVLLNGCNPARNLSSGLQWSSQWKGHIFPSEQKIYVDSVSGAKVVFATTSPAKDVNLYFDLNCWFKDQSCLFFTSDRRGKTELFGYIPKTGELVCFSPDQEEKKYWFATVDFNSHDVYMTAGNTIISWNIDLRFNKDSTMLTEVNVKERTVAKAPEGKSYISELSQSADGRFLSVASAAHNRPLHKEILAVDIQAGNHTVLCSVDDSFPISHVQFNKYNKYLLRFSHDSPIVKGLPRIWVADTRKPGELLKVHQQEPGELVTHEDWWVNDQLTFCGGYLKEESDVKLINIHDQQARIIGKGSMWEGAKPAELAKYNWWHASGSRDGKWVATDNWYGKIAIIDIRTSHLRLLTVNHRNYGKGEHPHVAWAPDSKSVEFTSNQRGNADVVLAYLPLEKWADPFSK